MIQIDLLKVWDLVKRWFPYVLSLVFLVLWIFKSSENNDLIEKNNDLENANIRSVVINEGLLDLVKQKNNKLSKSEAKIDSLNKEVAISKSKTSEIKKQSEIKQKEVYSYTTEKLADYYRQNYSPKEQIQTIGKDIVTGDTIAKQIVSDLVEKKYISLELNQTKETLNLTEKKSSEQDSVITDLKFQKEKLFMVIEEDKKVSANKDKIILNTEKAFKSEKGKKNFWKATAIGAGAVLVVKSLLNN